MGNIPRLDFFGLGLHPYSWIYEREFSTSLSIYMRDFKGVDLQRRVCKGVDIQKKKNLFEVIHGRASIMN